MNFPQRIFGESDISYSAQEAKTRLTSAITQDRSDCSLEVLDMIKLAIVETVSKYMDVNSERVQLSIAREGQTDMKFRPELTPVNQGQQQLIGTAQSGGPAEITQPHFNGTQHFSEGTTLYAG